MNAKLRKFSLGLLCCALLPGVATIFYQSYVSAETAPVSKEDTFVAGSASEFQYSQEDRTIRGFKTPDDQKPPLLLIHGSPGSYETFKRIANDDRLTENFQVIVVDRPGYGGSQKGDVEKSLEKQASSIKAALQYNKSNKPAMIVGYSFGGAIATRIAMDFPDILGKLLLLAPTLDPDLESPRWYERLGKAFSWVLPTEIRVYIDESYDLAQELRIMTPLYSKIHAQTHYVHGDRDAIVSVKTLEFAKRNFNSSRFTSKIVSGMDHYIPQDHPEVAIDAILELNSRN